MATELVRFTHDYQGVLTNERFHLDGEVAEVEDVHASALVERGHAEFADEADVEADEDEDEEEGLDDLTKDELEELAEELGVLPEEGSGSGGNVLKEDLIDAIEAAEGSDESDDEDEE